MTKPSPSEITRNRISNWIMKAQPVDINPTWTEIRRAIDFGGHTYIVENGQVFQCAHCGHFDPEWVATEVLEFFEKMGAKPYEVEVTCTFTKKES